MSCIKLMYKDASQTIKWLWKNESKGMVAVVAAIFFCALLMLAGD